MSQYEPADEAQHAADAAVIEDYEKHVNPAFAALVKFGGFDSVEVSARGCVVTDSRGHEFLDCAGGLGSLSVGYSHPRVVEAVKSQLDRMAFSTRLFFNAPQARLARRLAELTPGALQYSFFCNSGTEANEAAMKFARMSTGRTGFVSATNAFHGKTMGSLSVSGRDLYKTPFEPLLPGCDNVPYNDVAALESAVNGDTAAVLLEPIQGEAGVIVPDDGYLRAARDICDRHGALLIMDEVQTGLGRTGRMWGCDWDGVAPDMMTLAKGLSGSCVPIGAVVATPPIWAIFNENPLIHSSTFGGNPLACTAGLTALEVIETEGLVERSKAQGEKLIGALRATQAKYPQCVRAVRGKGLMIGVQFAHEDIGALAIVGLLQRNVIAAYTLNNPTTVRFEPPLVITDEQVQWAATAFDAAIAQTIELLADIDMDDEATSE